MNRIKEMWNNLSKEKRKIIEIIIIFIVIAAGIGFVITNSTLKGKNTTGKSDNKWNDLVLANEIPNISGTISHIYTNSDERLYFEIENITSKQFYDYIELCKETGYNVDILKEEFHFNAFSKNKYELDLKYNEYNKILDIELSKTKQLKEIEWPESDLINVLPTPNITVGEIEQNNNEIFSVILGNYSYISYKDYVTTCIENGFDDELKREDRKFSAKNSKKYSIQVDYLGNETIKISVKEPEYFIGLKIDFVENWIFSKYDVKLYVDNNSFSEETLTHGQDKEVNLTLKRGEHKLIFKNSEDPDIKGELAINADKDEVIELRINCYNSEVGIKVINDDNKSENVVENNVDNNVKTDIASTNENKISVYYSTNDLETAKKGETGVFSYIKKGSYDIYYIIDMDEKYVYYFTEGNGESTCTKAKIISGNLNDTLISSYNYEDSSWEEKIKFKTTNHPEKIVMTDSDNLDWEFEATVLSKALEIRNTKTIKDV